MRVFHITVNDEVFADVVDIYKQVGSYTAYEIYNSTNKPLGPYRDNLIFKADASPTSKYLPTLAAAEILQLFDNPMNATIPTADVDSKPHPTNSTS